MPGISREEYEDAVAAINALHKRIDKLEKAFEPSFLNMVLIIELIQSAHPDLMEEKLRFLRLMTQDITTGRQESKLTRQYVNQLRQLEKILKRHDPKT